MVSEVNFVLFGWGFFIRIKIFLHIEKGVTIMYKKIDSSKSFVNMEKDILKFWKEKNIKLGVYSSGSVAAQKLLFAHTTFGDLTPRFSNYFDTSIGAKREVESYKKIRETLNLNTEKILFLSDVEQELDAAQSAGFQTIQLVREGTVPSTKHKTAKNFKELLDLSYEF